MTHKVDIKQYMNLYTFLWHMLNMYRLLLANDQKMLDCSSFLKFICFVILLFIWLKIGSFLMTANHFRANGFVTDIVQCLILSSVQQHRGGCQVVTTGIMENVSFLIPI